jgi:hypothetical protein
MVSKKHLVAWVACSVFGLGAASTAQAAGVKVSVDTPFSFRASLTGVDTDPASIAGNDFQTFVFDYWTVLVNLRGDSIDVNGNEVGFYEIQLTHSGSKLADPTAPIVNTYLYYGGLQPEVTLTDVSVSSQKHGIGSDYLSTTVNIRYSPIESKVYFSGTIAGDSDADGNGTIDSDQTDYAVSKLVGLKDAGIITGMEVGQIIKQTKQPVK